ncbi:cytochrome P450 [Cyathus striatus]|nr:cytochrome P450 [Cyathus striatus]
MELTIWNILLAILVTFVLSRVQKLYNGIRATGNLPGFRIPFQAYAFPGGMFNTSWWNPGIEGVWHLRWSMYRKFGSDTISMVPFFMGRPAIFTSNWEVARQINAGSNKSAFGKMGMDGQGPMGYWGPNLLITEGELWRKHRRIVGPAFSQKLYELVWSQSLELYRQMLTAEGFEDQKVVDLPAVQQITFKFAFYIIGRCGFDFPFNWGEHATPVDGNVPFTEAMRFFIDNIQILNLPQKVLDLPLAKFKELNICIAEIRKFMDNKVAEKESEVVDSQLGDDIFSMLVQANQAEEDSKHKLNYVELISDVFLMLFAGHETTAHTLAATLACLARYPNQQQEVVDQIMSVVGTDRDPTIDDYPKLNKVQGAFYEALRMFPTAYVTIREAKEDTVLNVPLSLDRDECIPIAVHKDTQMIVDMVGIHQNPRYFDEPEVYKASRWYDVSNESEAMPGFGIGPRACIGRKFALTEAVGFITMVLREWKVVPLLSKGESVDQWFEGVSKCSALVTLGVGKVPLRFVRRAAA